MIIHSMGYLDLRHDFFRVCVFSCGCRLASNFLPRSTLLRRWPRAHHAYCFAIDFIALLALSWRAEMPSLDLEFAGFKRRLRHSVRNRLQRIVDQRHVERD